VDWTLVHDVDLTAMHAPLDWIPVLGLWRWTPDGLTKQDKDSDGLHLFRWPVVRGAVKVEYEVRASDPGDMSLFLGLAPDALSGAVFFGIASGGNAFNRISIDGAEQGRVLETGIASNQWHTITVLREAGRLVSHVDGEHTLSVDDTRDGYAGPYVGLYAWNPATIRRFRVWQRPDPALQTYLDPGRYHREHARPNSPFSLMTFAASCRESARAERGANPVTFAHLHSETTLAHPSVKYAMRRTSACRVDGKLAALFQSSQQDASGTVARLHLTKRVDGHTWSTPTALPPLPFPDGESGILGLAGGTWLATWSAPAGSGGAHYLCRSADDGLTWTGWLPAPVGAAHGPVQLKDGRLLYLGRAAGPDKALRLAVSCDEGKTWETLWDTALSASPDVQLYGTSLLERDDGTLIAHLSYDRRADWDALLWQMESTDGGRNWNTPHPTLIYGVHPRLTALPNGVLLCTYEGSRGVLGPRACVSLDRGRTWEAEQEIVIAGNAVDENHAAFPATCILDDGTCLSVYSQAGPLGPEDRTAHMRPNPLLRTTHWRLPASLLGPVRAGEYPVPVTPRTYREDAGDRKTPLTLDTLREPRALAARRRRRVIMNNDGGEGSYGRFTDESLTPETFLNERTTVLAGSHVDAIFYCDGVNNCYTHPSAVTETQRFVDHWRNWSYCLAEQGKEPLQLIIEFARTHEIEVFWSMRMNDTHDGAFPLLCSHWKKMHPEFTLLPSREAGQAAWQSRRDAGARGNDYGLHGTWAALNFALPEVREQVFRALADVVGRYDVDGVELDFFRFPLFFAETMNGRPATDEHVSMMTDLIGRVRTLTETEGMKRGKPLLIAVRVPVSTVACRHIGLDIETWLDRDLVDIVTGGGLYQAEPWTTLTALGRRHQVPVYACLTTNRYGSDPALWRGDALQAWEAGVDGIYTFNLFDPASPLFRELGDPAILREREHRYEHVEAGFLGRLYRYGIPPGHR
jgi:hypothetical protein